MYQHSSANVTGGKVFNTSVFDTRTCRQQRRTPSTTTLPYAERYNPDIQPNGT